MTPGPSESPGELFVQEETATISYLISWEADPGTCTHWQVDSEQSDPSWESLAAEIVTQNIDIS
jgi:phosphoribulokinase